MISRFTKQLKGAVILGALLVGSNAFAQLGLTWSEMGPNDIAGRCRSIFLDNTDPSGNKLFAAGVSGGVFKSVDAGATWAPVNDQSPSLIVSCMAQDAAGKVYFGTGETFGRGGDGAGSSGFVGTGLYSIISASTITQVKDSSVFGDVNEVAISTANYIYVAGQKGFFISTDGGVTFNEETVSATGTLAAMDVKVASNGDIYYSAGAKTSSTSAVYYCPFGSTIFTAITPTVIANRGRIEIAPSPVDPNYVYLSIAKQRTIGTTTANAASGGLSAVLVSNDKGTTWNVITIGTTQFDPFTTATLKGVGDYANTIVADPQKKDACYLGGDVFYGWSQIASNPLGQGSWFQIGINFPIPVAYFIHSNIHDVKFDIPNLIMYIATDGGIFKSAPGLSGFLSYNKGLNVSQFNSVAYSSFPRTTQTTNTLSPYAGVAGGSIGNSLNYMSGGFLNGPETSTSFGTTDAFQSDFSSISPKVLFYSGASGAILRSSDIDVSAPSTFYDNSYKGAVGGTSAYGLPGSSSFANENTPMRLWEGNASALFYNKIDSSTVPNSIKTKTMFTTVNARPQVSSKYDTILIRAVSAKQPTLATQKITIIPVYSGSVISSLNVIGNTPGPTSNTIFVTASLTDSVRYTFSTPPNDSSNITVTFKFRYNAGDVIDLKNTDVSGMQYTASITLTTALAASITPQPIIYVPLKKSARLATGTSASSSGNSGNSVSIYVVKRPLNFAVNPDWVKIAGNYSRVDSAGGTPYLATTASVVPNAFSMTPLLGTTVTRLEWAPDGNSLYFSTKSNDTTFYLYRISHLQFVGDSATDDYSGAFSSDLDSSYRPTPLTFGITRRKSVKQRTTPLGKFKYPITGIAVTADNMNVMLTLGGYKNLLSNVYYSNSDVRAMNLNNTDASNFTAKQGTGLPKSPAYTGIFEMNDNKRAIIGTENGIYSTSDVTQASPAWSKEGGGNFPNVPVFQIRQQTLPPWLCYNSGMIYAGTHGRGIWSTGKYFAPYAIGIEEHSTSFNANTNIRLYPNPASDATNLWFRAAGEAKYNVTVYDVNGKILMQHTTGKLMEGEQLLTLNTSELTAGIYFVTVNGSNNFSANTKLVITH